MTEAGLAENQVTALLHEYDGLRHELTTVAGSMATLGALGITVLAAAFGFTAQTEHLELTLAIPALVLMGGTQMLKFQVQARYLGVGLRAIERRVNSMVGQGTLTWEGTYNYSLGVPSNRNDSWAAIIRREPLSQLSNALLILLFALALLIALSLGAKFLVELNTSLALRLFLALGMLLVYSSWGGVLVWLTLVRVRTFIAEAEKAHGLTTPDAGPAPTGEKET